MKKYLLFILILTANAYAGGGASSSAHHEAPGIATLIWPVINFAIYFGILTYAYKNFIKPSLVGKEASVRDEIESAKTELLEANSNLEIIKSRKENIESEKEELAAKIAKEGKMQASVVLEDAKNQSAKIARDTQLRIDTEFSSVQSGIRAEIVKRALNSVKKDLKGSLSESQDSEIRKDTLRSALS